MKNCFFCKFYGKCAIDNKVCKDYILYNRMDRDVVVNIAAFDAKWKMKHKRWWMKLNPVILAERLEKANFILKGKFIDDWLDEQNKLLYKNVKEDVKNEKNSIS